MKVAMDIEDDREFVEHVAADIITLDYDTLALERYHRLAQKGAAGPSNAQHAAGPFDALVEERGAVLLHVLDTSQSLVDRQISWERIVEIDAELSKHWPMPTH